MPSVPCGHWQHRHVAHVVPACTRDLADLDALRTHTAHSTSKLILAEVCISCIEVYSTSCSGSGHLLLLELGARLPTHRRQQGLGQEWNVTQ